MVCCICVCEMAEIGRSINATFGGHAKAIGADVLLNVLFIFVF